MSKTLNVTTLQLKNGTRANWTSINPVLAKGELGLESDTAHFKFGDGVSAWTALSYAGTIVQASGTNGHLTIDGTDITVYSLPIGNASVVGGVKSSTGTNAVTIDAAGAMSVSHVGTADVLNTTRTISVSGDATGNTSFNGSANANIAVALVATGVSAGTYTKLTVDAKGRATVGDTLAASDIPSITLSKISDAGTAAAKNTGTAAGNVPVLDSSGKLDSSVIPALAISEINEVASETAMLALTAQVGDVAVRTDTNTTYMLKTSPASTLANWTLLRTPTGTVLSVNGKTGAVTLTTANIAEGTNLYWTEARGTANFNTNFAAKSVTGLSDGANVVMNGDSIIIDCGTVG